jgi:hypothetical protein
MKEFILNDEIQFVTIVFLIDLIWSRENWINESNSNWIC